MRHFAVGQLWVQEGLRRGDFELYKVRGDQNPADILTKSVPREVLDRHLRTLGLARADGRAASAPHAQLASLGHNKAFLEENALEISLTNIAGQGFLKLSQTSYSM